MVLCRYASTWVWEIDFTRREWKKNWDSKDEMLFIYFTNGRYIECLSLNYATNKSKT